MIEKFLEKILIQPFLKKITEKIQRKCGIEDEEVNQKRKKLEKEDPDVFGFSDYLKSLDWVFPINCFNTLKKCKLPFEYFNVLTRTVFSIYQTIEKQMENREDQVSNQLISGDDFLSIFIYLICHSDINNLQTITEFMVSYSDPSEFANETGYYLTTFCTAVEFIKNQ
ncbi:hypothetical protein M0811_10695 [Anaeramoeba ignava]|uniref:VPS9 domain-containing protein n=1 Tax=Anaeramoeba ignava TaxID=1746090 RepID=A0A9Q0LG48_ANAIG|nr:hypothetical protein M0811_10695 [Anaeramoeba ignava]